MKICSLLPLSKSIFSVPAEPITILKMNVRIHTNWGITPADVYSKTSTYGELLTVSNLTVVVVVLKNKQLQNQNLYFLFTKKNYNFRFICKWILQRIVPPSSVLTTLLRNSSVLQIGTLLCTTVHTPYVMSIKISLLWHSHKLKIKVVVPKAFLF